MSRESGSLSGPSGDAVGSWLMISCADALALCEGIGEAGPGLSSVLLGVLEALARSRRMNKRKKDVDPTTD
jgi:hypothetical protein